MNESLKADMIKWFDKGKRYDGRSLTEFRNVSVERGVSKNAEGSARVKFGSAEIIAGVKLSVETPYPDTPSEGNLMVNVELLPLSSPDFETGPPGDAAVEAARVVDRGIRESKALDMRKLCIEEGQKVWMVSIDICTVNADGNLIDASALAALTALQDARFPAYDADKGVDYKSITDNRLPLLKTPVEVTIFKMGSHLFVDPTNEEETVSDARLTVAVTEDGRLCALQKGGTAALSLEETGNMVELACVKAKELFKSLPKR